LSNHDWILFINQKVISWIHARTSQDPNSFGYYVREIENIRNMLRSMAPLNFIACGEGFKIHIVEEDVVLRCAYFLDERQVHIVDVIQ
jgi:hypothetical protein